eukprot:3599430-Rhodomonas_salina.1
MSETQHSFPRPVACRNQTPEPSFSRADHTEIRPEIVGVSLFFNNSRCLSPDLPLSLPLPQLTSSVLCPPSRVAAAESQTDPEQRRAGEDGTVRAGSESGGGAVARAVAAVQRAHHRSRDANHRDDERAAALSGASHSDRRSHSRLTGSSAPESRSSGPAGQRLYAPFRSTVSAKVGPMCAVSAESGSMCTVSAESRRMCTVSANCGERIRGTAFQAA